MQPKYLVLSAVLFGCSGSEMSAAENVDGGAIEPSAPAADRPTTVTGQPMLDAARAPDVAPPEDAGVDALPDAVSTTTGVSFTSTSVTTDSVTLRWSSTTAGPQLLFARLGLYAGTQVPPGPDCWMANPAYSQEAEQGNLPISGTWSFTGLQPGRTYSALVCVSQNVLNAPPLRAQITITTASIADAGTDAAAPPATPTYIPCTNLDNGITVRWSSPATGFWVIQRLVGTPPTSCTDFGSTFINRRQWDVNGQLGKSYIVWVCASGPGGLSAPLKVRATEPIMTGQNGFCTEEQ